MWFLKQYWGTGVEYNGSGFSSPRFDELIALGERGPIQLYDVMPLLMRNNLC